MGRADVITDLVKRYDPLLYCESRDGKLCIYRKSQRIESYDVNGVRIGFVRPAPFIVFALTDSWSLAGEPRDWGLLPIRERLTMIDSWHRDVAKELLDKQEARAKSKDRDLDNHIESYLKDVRKDFARATNDVNTSTLSKTAGRKQ